jgi:hypothetical protein
MTSQLLEIGRKYALQNGTNAVYEGVEKLRDIGDCLKFISRISVSDWFRYSYIPVNGANLKGRKIMSERGVVHTESVQRQDLAEAIFNNEMRKHYSRIFGKRSLA